MNIAATLAELDRLQSIHPHTNLRKHEAKGPVIMTRGRGIHVYDVEGREYIEGMAGLWCAALGFSDERLVAAATRQLATLPYYHGFAHKTSDVAIEVARDLLAIAPGKMARAFFGTSGSDANDTAIKMVRYYNNALGRPGKKKLVAGTRGYHGVSIATASLTGLPNIHAGFDLPGPGVVHADCPHHYRYAAPGESEEAFAGRLVASLEALIEREGPDTIAAFIAEPVMGAGGVIVPPPTYFDKVQNMLFKEIGQDKTLFQVSAVATNGIFGNQTFGITSGTLGCSQPSKFVQNEKLEKFVADNMYSIAQDIASGRGEAVSTLAEMMEVPSNDRAAFYSLLQANFNNIYTSSSVQYSEVIDNIIKVVSNS